MFSSLVIKHRSIPNKYLCYDSFKADLFWGPKHLSEKYSLGSKIMKQLLNDIPEGTEFYLKENYNNALCEKFGSEVCTIIPAVLIAAIKY